MATKITLALVTTLVLGISTTSNHQALARGGGGGFGAHGGFGGFSGGGDFHGVSEGFAAEALVLALDVLGAAENFGVVLDVLGAGSAFMVAAILTFHTGTAATLIPMATDATECRSLRDSLVGLGLSLGRGAAPGGRIASEIGLSNFNPA